jgi:hypothetical protein
MGSGSRGSPVRGRAGPHPLDARPQWVDPEDWSEDADLQALAEPSTEIMVRSPGGRAPAARKTTSVQIVGNPRRPMMETPELDPDTDGETQTGDVEPAWAAVPAPDQSPQYPPRLPAPRTPAPAPRSTRAKGAPLGMVAALGLTSVAFAAVGLFAAIVVVWSFMESGEDGADQPNPLQRIGLAIQERLNRETEEVAAPAEAPPAPLPAPAFEAVALQPPPPIVAPKPTPAAPKPAPSTTAAVTSAPRSAPPVVAPAPSAPVRAVQPRPRAPVHDEESMALDTWLLIVRAEADGVLVEIDGRQAVPAPAKASVAPGKHRLRLWSNGVASDLIVDVKGDPFEVCFDGKGRTIRKVDCK